MRGVDKFFNLKNVTSENQNTQYFLNFRLPLIFYLIFLYDLEISGSKIPWTLIYLNFDDPRHLGLVIFYF